MSILSYCKRSLPTPEETGLGDSATREANWAVKRVLSEVVSEPAKKKRKKYPAFTDKQRAAIGKYAVKCGNAAALRKYRPEVSDLGESTVHLFKKHYLEQLRLSPGTEITSITTRKRGHPLTQGDIDKDVQKFNLAHVFDLGVRLTEFSVTVESIALRFYCNQI